MARQYVACKFREGDARSYTYHNDGEPLVPGDWAKVADRDGDGWKRVLVVVVNDATPPFATKPILGKVTGDDTDARILSGGGDGDLLADGIAF